MQRKSFGIISVDFDTTGQLLIIHIPCSSNSWEKWEYNEAVHQLFIDFKKAYDSVRWEVLYNILIQSDIPTKLVSLIKLVWMKPIAESVGKHLFHTLPIKSGLK